MEKSEFYELKKFNDESIMEFFQANGIEPKGYFWSLGGKMVGQGSIFVGFDDEHVYLIEECVKKNRRIRIEAKVKPEQLEKFYFGWKFGGYLVMFRIVEEWYSLNLLNKSRVFRNHNQSIIDFARLMGSDYFGK